MAGQDLVDGTAGIEIPQLVGDRALNLFGLEARPRETKVEINRIACDGLLVGAKGRAPGDRRQACGVLIDAWTIVEKIGPVAIEQVDAVEGR